MGVMRPGREAAHPLSVLRSRNAWIYTSTPPYAFMAWCSVKKRTGTTLPLHPRKWDFETLNSDFLVVQIFYT